MDILLIPVPADSEKHNYDQGFNFSRSLSFGLLSIATYLSQGGFDAQVFDPRCIAGNIENSVLNAIAEIRPNFIGLSCTSGFSYTETLSLAAAIRKEHPRIPILAGGKDHIGIIAKTALYESPSIDVIIIGEGELVMPLVLERFKKLQGLGDVPNVAFRGEKGQPLESQIHRDFVPHQLPRLDYRLYKSFNEFSPSVEVSRGCPYNCAFCVGYNNLVRKKPILDIIEETAYLCNLYQRSDLSIYFETPCFIFNDREIKELMQLRSARDLEFTWRTEARVEYLTEHRIACLKEAGCRVIDVGLESAAPEILCLMGKTDKPQEYLEAASIALSAARREDILLKINILFYAGETLASLRKTFSFLMDHRDHLRCISAYPMFLHPAISNLESFKYILREAGGSLEASSLWEDRRVHPVNSSSELTYSRLKRLGILFGKAFQSADDFVRQKTYGYLPPGRSVDSVLEYISSRQENEYPCHLTSAERDKARHEIERELGIKN